MIYDGETTVERPEGFVQTSVYLKIKQHIDLSLRAGSPVVYVGPAGIGKTYALKEIARQTPRAYYCCADQGCRTAAGLLQAIYRAVFGTVSGDRRPYTAIRYELENRLRPTSSWDEDDPSARATLFFDEVQTLTALMRRDLHALREQANFNLVMAANGQALAKRGRDETPELMKQITTRERLIKVGGPEPDDVDRIVDTFNVEFSAGNSRAYDLCKDFVTQTGNIRELVQVLNFAKSNTIGGKPISYQDLLATMLAGSALAKQDIAKISKK